MVHSAWIFDAVDRGPKGSEEVPELLVTQKETLLATICRNLKESQTSAYLVGGAVRDMLLGRDTTDIDIAVDGNAIEVARRMADTGGGVYVPLDEENRIGRVVLIDPDSGKRWTFDFSKLRGSITEDLAERDFTINSMAVDLGLVASRDLCFYGLLQDMVDLPVIDPYGGQSDLHQGLIRKVSQHIFNDDPARLMRAVRFKAELDFEIDGATEALINRQAALLKHVAGERIHEEIVRLLNVPDSGSLLGYLDKLGILTVLIPELVPARETTQPKEHHWNVLEHSLNTAVASDFLLHQGKWLYKGDDILAAVPWSPQLADYFSCEIGYASKRSSLMKIAALLHDIAKPQTKTIDDNGKMRFLGHDRQGAEAVVPIMERLRFSNREIKTVELCIRYHLRPTQLTHEDLPSRRALYRYFRDTGETAIDILFFSLADHLATRGPELVFNLWQEHVKLVEYSISQYYKTEEVVSPVKLIDGNDLINLFNLRPGPRIGEILESVREAQASGEIIRRDQALVYISKILKDRTGKQA